MTFASILGHIRRTKKQAEYNASDSYYSMIRLVASGVEIDADCAGVAIEAANKTESDFENDILILSKRSQAEKMLAAAETARQRSIVLESQIEKLCIDLDAICLPIKQKIQAATAELRQCESIAATSITAQRILSENVLSDGAGQRKLECNAEIKRLLASRAAVLGRVPNPTRAKTLQIEIDRRQENLAGMKEGHSDSRKEYEQRQIDDAQWALTQHNSQTGACDGELWEIANAIRDCQTELAKP